MKMRNYLRRMTACMAGAAMLIGGAAFAYAEDTAVYDYENKYLWYVPTDSFTWDTYETLAQHHSAMGGTSYDGTEFDIEELINSPLGETLINNSRNFVLYSDQYGEQEYAYWESLGIRKEMHDASSRNGQWATFTPIEAYEEENAEKTYPVLFVFHGKNNPIYFTETYGYAQLAAQEGFICVIPWAANGGGNDEEEGTTLDAEVDRIMEVLRAEYPIDESRIYAAGYSMGGRSTVRETIKHPNLFAAITVGGHNLWGIRSGETGYTFEDAEWDALEETPVLQIDGDNEMRIKFPYGYEVTGEDAVNGLNKWFAVNNIDREITMEECQNIVDTTEDTAQRKIGLDADEIYTQYYDGTEYYTADFYNEDGVNMIKLINVEGMIHWMTQNMAQNAWDFMSQYARDTETNELIVLSQDYEPQLEPEEIVSAAEGSFIQDYTYEAEINGDITVTVKASKDVTGYTFALEDGTALDSNAEVEENEDGFNYWTLTTSVDHAGKMRLDLTPLTNSESNTLKLPVLVQ